MTERPRRRTDRPDARLAVWLNRNRWVNYFTMDQGGEIFGFELTPHRYASYWDAAGSARVRLPEDLVPSYHRCYGVVRDWRDSLQVR